VAITKYHEATNGDQPMTAQTAEATPELPSKMDEVDLFKLELLSEKQTRIQAQLANLQQQFNQLAAEYEKAKRDYFDFAQVTAIKYKVGDKDTYDKATGIITRQPQTPPATQAEAKA
jgi:hypothetical protein